jgi:hypothetical protein
MGDEWYIYFPMIGIGVSLCIVLIGLSCQEEQIEMKKINERRCPILGCEKIVRYRILPNGAIELAAHTDPNGEKCPGAELTLG